MKSHEPTEGHATLRALLDHTGDPLPLVLALDDMDPDHHRTQIIAAQIVSQATNALFRLFFRDPDDTHGLRADPDPWSKRITAAHLTPTEAALFQGSSPVPRRLTPTEAVRRITTITSAARKLDLNIELDQIDRHMLATLTEGPPTALLTYHHEGEPLYYHDIDLYTSKRYEPILQRISRELSSLPYEVLPSDTKPYIFRNHSFQSQLSWEVREQDTPEVLSRLTELLKQNIPNITIHTQVT